MSDILLTNDYDEIITKNRHTILDGIFGAQTPQQVESSIGFSNYLSHVGITSSNYYLFLKLIETNNRWVVDMLIKDRDPRLLFSVIKPNNYLLRRAFELLSFWHPGQIYRKVLLSVLGIIEYCFYKPDEGYSIYPLDIVDLNNLGKFLDIDKDQFDYINESILEILNRITQLGEHSSELRKSVLSKHAFNIRIAYFDNTKSLTDIIPQVLLVRLKPEEREVKPSREFIAYMKKIVDTDTSKGKRR